MKIQGTQITPTALVRPGDTPTPATPEAGEVYHYLTLAGEKVEPPVYIYRHTESGWSGECDGYIYPDGHSPRGVADRAHIETRIEAELLKQGIHVVRPVGAVVEA